MGVAAALERQQQARARGDSVLSVVAAETPSTWGAWAASRGCLTLLVEEADHERAIESLLAQ
ncbi:MAG TPA: hypothetical protein VK427_05965, partial [Kofleriaceae bacterium]|nr:hypothetical protein [Kofleriaceae bacterium]